MAYKNQKWNKETIELLEEAFYAGVSFACKKIGDKSYRIQVEKAFETWCKETKQRSRQKQACHAKTDCYYRISGTKICSDYEKCPHRY